MDRIEQPDDNRTRAELVAENACLRKRLARARNGQPCDPLCPEHKLVTRLMETSPVSITIANRQGEIVFANARAEEVLGLGKSEITQLTYDAPEWRITDYAGHPFPREDLPFVQVMRTQAPVYHVRHAIEWPNGRRRLLSINGAPLLNGDGEIERIVFAIEDVTAQVKAEQERIAKLKRELRAVAKIAAYPATSIAARSFGTLPLREQSADLYQQLIETYRKLLESALEQRAYKSKRDLSSEIRALANRLGNEGARPRDVIDVHIAALRDKQAEANPRKSAAYAEEGRLIALELMGDLVTYYRTRCVGINRSDS